MVRAAAFLVALLLLPVLVPTVATAAPDPAEPVRVTALAVARNGTGGLEGTSSTVSVTAQPNGSGHVFIDTRPLAGTDMQGSARLATRVAASLTGYDAQAHDLFFVIRSDSPVIAGPSAGATLALGATVALENAHRNASEEPWRVDPGVMATGTVTPGGYVGPVGGILAKAEAAADAGAHTFLVPEGQATYTPRVPGSDERPDPVHVPTYCREELNITCQEVARVEELVEVATGHDFKDPQQGEPPTTARYTGTLQPQAQQLVEDAARLHTVWEELNASSLEPRERDAVEQVLRRGLQPLGDAQTDLEGDRYYSAASRAFQTSIHVRHAELLLRFYQEGRSLDVVSGAIDDAAATVADARNRSENASVDGLQDLYTVGAAQQRVIQAGDRVDQARVELNRRNVARALYHAGFAMERAETATWWLDLGRTLGSGPSLAVPVNTTATDLVDLSQEMLAYSNSVLRGRGDLAPAKQAVSRATRAEAQGFHAAAVLEATEAQVLATLPLEVQAESPTPDKVNASRAQAAEAIQRARGRGLEPILPVAMFEFATDQQDPTAKLRFLRTSAQLAGLSATFTGASEPRPSEYIADPADRLPHDGGDQGPVQPAAQATGEEPVPREAAVGFALGAVTTLVVVGAVAGVGRLEP